MEFSRQEYWSGLPFPSLGDLPDPGMEPTSPVPPAFASRFFTASATWEASYASLCWAVTSRVRLFDHTDCSSPGSSVHTFLQARMSSHSLLQGIFPTQGLNPGLLHCRQILYHLSHQGSLRILEWVTYPFSRGTSQPRN